MGHVYGGAELLLSSNGALQWMLRTMRDSGRQTPRWVWNTGESRRAIGILQIKPAESLRHRRLMTVATFSVPDTQELLLRDVRIVTLDHGSMMLTGFELVEDREYAQSWFCRLARCDVVERGKPDEETGFTND